MDDDNQALHMILAIIIVLILALSYAAATGTGNSQQQHVKTALKKKTGIVSAEKNAVMVQEIPAEQKLISSSSPTVYHTKEALPKENHPEIADHRPNKTATQRHPENIAVIQMENDIYESHKKGIVSFNHKAHVVEYHLECGTCHHDETGAPLHLSFSEPVEKCSECHVETQAPKGEKLDKTAKIMKYHFEALHANCIGCHKSYNIKNGDPRGKKPAPVLCTGCHPKTDSAQNSISR